MYIYMYVYIYMCIYIYIYVCICVYIYIYMYVCIYMYTKIMVCTVYGICIWYLYMVSIYYDIYTSGAWLCLKEDGMFSIGAILALRIHLTPARPRMAQHIWWFPFRHGYPHFNHPFWLMDFP